MKKLLIGLVAMLVAIMPVCYAVDEPEILLHFNGADASTTITNNGTSAAGWTVVGDTQLDTAQKKFGTASLIYDGTDDYLYSTSAEYSTSGTLTFDYWVRFASTGVATRTMICMRGIAVNVITATANANAGAWVIFGINVSKTIVADTWYHVRICRSLGQLYFYINGHLEGQRAITDDWAGATPKIILNYDDWNASQGILGHIDEFYFNNSVALSTGDDFTPPTREFGAKSGGPVIMITTG